MIRSVPPGQLEGIPLFFGRYFLSGTSAVVKPFLMSLRTRSEPDSMWDQQHRGLRQGL